MTWHAQWRAAGGPSLPPVSPRRPVRVWTWCALCCGTLMNGAWPVQALDFQELHHRYTITTWSVRDGLPAGSITAVTQDVDGYLWLGSSEGLVRFDGTSFEADAQLPREAVRALCSTRDGSVWVGFGAGNLIARVGRAGSRQYGPEDGVGQGVLNAIVEDGRGTLWVGSTDGLRRLVGDRFVKVSETEGVPDVSVTSLTVGPRGDLLVGTRQGVYRQASAARGFELLDSFDDGGRGVQGLAEDHHGRVWAADGRTGLRRLGPGSHERPPGQARGIRLLIDGRGGLWLSTTGTGLWHVDLRQTGAGATFSRAPVSGGRALYEDREGNIWVGTIEGLVRLSERRIREVPGLATAFSIEAAPDGRVWVASADRLMEFDRSSEGWRRRELSLVRAPVRAMTVTRGGAVWVANSAGLQRVDAGRASTLALPGGMSRAGIEALATSPDGGVLWIATAEHGLLKWPVRSQTLPKPVPGLTSTRFRSIVADSRGRLWLTTLAGRLGCLDGDESVRWFGADDGLGVSTSYSLHESQGEIWVAGMDGLRRHHEGRFQEVAPAHHQRWSVPTIVEDTDGDFWLGTNYGIAWVTRDEISKWRRDQTYRVDYTIFDSADGLAGRPGMWGGRTSAMSSDGQLWFITGRGIALADPRRLKQPRPPVAVRIDRIEVDGRDLETGGPASRATRGSRVVVTYRALELTTPDKVRFRYRLDGFDAEWVEAGTRRQATYDSLPPRSYRFRVAASHTEGTWSQHEAMWEFAVTPRFYQTTWFAVASVVSLLTAVWGYWRLRLRRSRMQFAALLGERVRLSRELHDTLLQSLVGVALQLEAASNCVDANSPASDRLMKARRQVEGYIREARLSIWNLRSHQPARHDLVKTLQDAADRISAVAVPVHVKVSGMPPYVDPVIGEHLRHIGQEAILNAARHATAHRISVEIVGTNGTITIRVSDDGQGFDTAEWVGEASGHMGLVSMRERAEQVGGRFTLKSEAGTGTVVEVVAPISRPSRES